MRSNILVGVEDGVSMYKEWYFEVVIGCSLDLDIPEMWFSLNGLPVESLLRESNRTGMFYPAIPLSAHVSCRFIFGGEHGRFIHQPPEDAALLYEAMLIKQKVSIEPCFSFGNIEQNRPDGSSQIQHHITFTP